MDKIDINRFPIKIAEIYKKTKDNTIFQLFPYVRTDYEKENAIKEITESINNLKTRLSNLKKINKSLNDIDTNTSKIAWDDLKNITFNLHKNDEVTE